MSLFTEELAMVPDFYFSNNCYYVEQLITKTLIKKLVSNQFIIVIIILDFTFN